MRILPSITIYLNTNDRSIINVVFCLEVQPERNILSSTNGMQFTDRELFYTDRI